MALYSTLQTSADSKEARQLEQITLETAIQNRLGEISATPTANTLNDRLLQLLNRFGDAIASPTANTLLARVSATVTSLASILTGVGAPADTSATSDNGTFSLTALVKRGLATLTTANSRLSSIISSVDALYPTTSSGSTPVASSVTNVVSTVIAASSRKGFTLYNAGSVTAFIDFNTAASATTYAFPLPPGYLYTDEFGWVGNVSAITASGTTSILVRTFGA